MLGSDWLLALLAAALLAHALIVYHRYRGRRQRSDTGSRSGSTATDAPSPAAARSAITCQHCGAKNDDSYRYCRACASELPRRNTLADSSDDPLGRIPR
jgi:hypothetical protein